MRNAGNQEEILVGGKGLIISCGDFLFMIVITIGQVYFHLYLGYIDIYGKL